MMKVALLAGSVAAYEQEWAEFQAEQGSRNGGIPAAFKSNVDIVKSHNSQNLTYTLSYTGPFADITPDEFLAQYTGLGDIATAEDDIPKFHDEVPEKILADAMDWTQQGAVNPIKNQGSCGSCWAFSTVGTLESAYKIAAGSLYSLAEQQLVDCDKSNDGCSGGWPHSAYDSYYTGASVCTESSYAYTARDGSCSASSCSAALPRGTITGHQNVASSSSGLKNALSSQPVSVTVNAGQLQLYANGVVTGDCSGQINHAVIAVGYGIDGLSYFKIRNSWGTGWGESGYIRVAQDGGSKGTACLFQYSPVTPTLSTSPVPTPGPTPSPTPSPTPGCVDTDAASDCSYWTGAGYCSSSSEYFPYMQEHCCHSCGFGSIQV